MAPRRVVLRNSSPESAPASDDSNAVSAGESGAEDAGLAFSSSESDIDYASGGRAPAVRLTARQRALAARSGDDSATGDDDSATGAQMDDEHGERMAAAPAPRSAPDADALQREEQKRRRTDQRDARLQQTRAETIQRLLQKKGGRAAKRAAAAPAPGAEDAAEARPHWTDLPVPADAVRVVVRREGALFGVGERYAGALPSQFGAPSPVVSQRCAARGCTSARTCVHPRSGRPMCASLRCYRALS